MMGQNKKTYPYIEPARLRENCPCTKNSGWLSTMSEKASELPEMISTILESQLTLAWPNNMARQNKDENAGTSKNQRGHLMVNKIHKKASVKRPIDNHEGWKIEMGFCAKSTEKKVNKIQATKLTNVCVIAVIWETVSLFFLRWITSNIGIGR